MKVEEHLLWIMDDKKDSDEEEQDVTDRSGTASGQDGRYRHWQEKIKKNIEFVRSLGLSCDSVGWCNLDLNGPDADKLLDQIRAFASREKLYLRGYYSRRFSDFESEWYLLESVYLSNGEWDYADVSDTNGNPLRISELYACKVPRYVQVLWERGLPCVTERFRDCCLRHGFSGVDFYWIRDKGRYHATQFFGLMIDRMVPEFACDRYLSYSDSKDSYKKQDHSPGSPLYQRFLQLGGRLPELSQMFYDLNVDLPVQLPRNQMPETDFAYLYFFRPDYHQHYALIRKRAAEILVTEKAIRQEYLIPVALYDTEPAGYYIQPSEPIPYPAADVVRRLASDYEALKQNPRPERKVSEKDALKLLRKIKSLRREDFHKGMAKKQLAAFAATPYERLAPYYAISDGGYLSDEYRFLPYSESAKETQGYAVSLEQEGMPDDRLRGIVIAACADGDLVVVCEDGTVNRISHETMDVYESWDSVAQFFYDTILDDE
jgi:hypothetical protein